MVGAAWRSGGRRAAALRCPAARIRERYRAWEDCGADTLNVRSRQPEAIEVMAQAVRLN